MSTEIWRFETKRFAVIFTAETEYDLDLSWDETGEVTGKIESGFFDVFCAKISVELDGNEISADYLGNCIYENASDFIDHRGMIGKGHGSYFSGMVKQAISEARDRIEDMESVPTMRQTKPTRIKLQGFAN